MKSFVALYTTILAVTAFLTEFNQNGVIDYVGDVIQDAANFTDGRVPTGQAGFATMNGGTVGGTGGAVWTVWDPWTLRDAIGANHRTVYIHGRIDLTPLFSGSPGIILSVGSYISIIGGDSKAMIFGGGINITQTQVIVQNIKFHNALSYAPSEKPDGNGGISSFVPGEYSIVDGITIHGGKYVWIDHCEFADDPWIAPSIPRRHDGLIDIVHGANWISVSNSIFRNHDHVMLIGNSNDNAAQDVGRLKVTLYLNWFQGTRQRNPRVRFGEVHVLNNLHTEITLLAVGVGSGALVYGEGNVFVDTPHCWGHISADPMGYYMDVNNLLINSGYDGDVPSYGVTWRPSNYYWYSPMNVNNVEQHVRTYAGTW